jgi:hypothetical protein
MLVLMLLRTEVAFNIYAQRVAGVNKVLQDQVDDVLVKDLDVTERIDVELQTLQLNAAFIRNVFQANGRKIRKIRERTDAGKLGIWN